MECVVHCMGWEDGITTGQKSTHVTVRLVHNYNIDFCVTEREAANNKVGYCIMHVGDS